MRGTQRGNAAMPVGYMMRRRRVVFITNVEYYVYHNLAALIQGPNDLSDNDDDDSDNDDTLVPKRVEDANPICKKARCGSNA